MDELEALRLRDEVLQAMYWMRSEGLAERCPAAQLASFLAIGEGELTPYLERFTDEGLLELDAGGYALTASGVDQGRRTFAEEFADLTRPGHGECDENCWCHDSPEAAADCLAERTGHVHG